MSKDFITVFVGYWKSISEPSLPTPIPNGWNTPNGKKGFLKWLKEFIKNHCQTEFCYHGWSHCRICGARNGTSEYKLRVVTNDRLIFMHIPEGFIHYVRDHDVKPNMDFFTALKAGRDITPFITPYIYSRRKNQYILK